MPAPTFDPDTGGRQPIDTRSKHDFALNSHNFTVTIEATSWGNGVDLQTACRRRRRLEKSTERAAGQTSIL
jgi:hypothetical protein